MIKIGEQGMQSRTWRPYLFHVVLETTVVTGLIAGVSLLLRLASLNPTTVALVMLITVLLLGAWRGTFAGVFASILATASLNFFFLPPLHTWNIEDPGNWIALGCFLVASILAGRLVGVARREAASAESRRMEAEAMYGLSIDLFQTTSHSGRLDEAARRALNAVSASDGGLVLFEGSFYRQRVVWWSGDRDPLDEDVIAGTGRHRRVVELPGPSGRDMFLPLVIGGRVDGVFIVRRTAATIGSLENVATLLALAAERERLFREQAHIEAIRESDRLKTSLLRAVSHDLASPLTALTLHASRIRRLTSTENISVVEALDQELSRLKRRIDKLLAYARLEAGIVAPSPEPTPSADLFRSVRENLPTIDRDRMLVIQVDDDCPDLFVDPSLALEVMINLVENADSASPAGAPLILRAFAISPKTVRIEVQDQGPGIDLVPSHPDSYSQESSHPERRGLGLEIVQGLLRSIGGSLAYLTESGATVARVDLPASHVSADELEQR